MTKATATSPPLRNTATAPAADKETNEPHDAATINPKPLGPLALPYIGQGCIVNGDMYRGPRAAIVNRLRLDEGRPPMVDVSILQNMTDSAGKAINRLCNIPWARWDSPETREKSPDMTAEPMGGAH